MTKDEALMLAMEAMEITGGFDVEINAIKEALAQPEQEPVAWQVGWVDDGGTVFWKDKPPADGADLYTSPPQRKWVGLTQDEFKQIMLDTYNIDLNAPGHSSDDHLLWRAIEAKLISKNACEENATDPSKEDWDSACNNLAEARTIPNPKFDKAHTQHKPNTA